MNDLLIEEVVAPPASSFVDRLGMPDVTRLTYAPAVVAMEIVLSSKSSGVSLIVR